MAAAIGALASSSALGQDPVQKTSLKTRLAVNIAEMAVAECAVDGYSVSAAVTDRSGVLLALVRFEKAGAHTADASRQKAFTSASSRSPTSAIVENVAGNPRVAGLADIPGYLVLAGGVPIKVGEGTIGAVGVAGAPNGGLDEDCANIAIEEVKRRLM
ncbi:heme-binding protein (plasmid) [Ensifer aridi]